MSKKIVATCYGSRYRCRDLEKEYASVWRITRDVAIHMLRIIGGSADIWPWERGWTCWNGAAERVVCAIRISKSISSEARGSRFWIPIPLSFPIPKDQWWAAGSRYRRQRNFPTLSEHHVKIWARLVKERSVHGCGGSFTDCRIRFLQIEKGGFLEWSRAETSIHWIEWWVCCLLLLLWTWRLFRLGSPVTII